MANYTNPIGTGSKTSEFKAMLGTTVASFAAFGVVAATGSSTDLVEPLTELIMTMAAGAVATLTAGWMVIEYIKGRRDVKVMMIEKGLVAPQEVVAPEPGIPELA